jgi:hypothetical protein
MINPEIASGRIKISQKFADLHTSFNCSMNPGFSMLVYYHLEDVANVTYFYSEKN